MTAEQGETKKSGRGKKASTGGWNWLKSKRGSNALLATIAGAVATGLAVAGIIVPLNDLKQRMGVVEASRLDPVLDHLEAVDQALAAIQKADPVGAVATLAPQVKELAGQVGDIKEQLSGAPVTTTTLAAAPTATPTVITVPPTTVSPAVLARLDAAESKLGQLSTSLATEQETTRTLSTAVATIRDDLSKIFTELTATKAATAAAQATADRANRLLPAPFFLPSGGFSNIPANATTIQAQVGVISVAAGEKILFRWGGAFDNGNSLGSTLDLLVGTKRLRMAFTSTGYREHVALETFAAAVTDAPLKVSFVCHGSSQGSTNTAPCSLTPIVVSAQRLP